MELLQAWPIFIEPSVDNVLVMLVLSKFNKLISEHDYSVLVGGRSFLKLSVHYIKHSVVEVVAELLGSELIDSLLCIIKDHAQDDI